MDIGFEKIRRNLIISCAVTTVYFVAELEPQESTFSLLNFKVGNPESIGILLIIGMVYFWVRYMTYYFQHGLSQYKKNALRDTIKIEAVKHFEKKYPMLRAGAVNIYEDLDTECVDEDGHWNGRFEPARIEITNVTPQSLVDESYDIARFENMTIYKDEDKNTGQDYNKIMRRARWLTPIKNSFHLEKIAPLFLPVIVLAVAFFYSYTPAPRVTFIDGDTFKTHGETVRLHGIDAFEQAQTCVSADVTPYPCGGRASAYLKTLFKGEGILTCKKRATDHYGRTVATCEINGKDIATSLVRAGWALDNPKYSKGAYKDAQNFAQKNKAGAWAGTFKKPWQWRKDQKQSNDEKEK